MEIKAIELIGQTQTEDQKKQQREKITKLMLNPIQEAEKELIGASSCQHLFKYVSLIEKEKELQREEREKQDQLLRQSLEYQQWQREHHKQMRIDEQVEAMRIVKAEKQQVNVDAGTVSHAGTEPKPREGGYNLRDEFAIRQVKDRPELLEMRAGMIKAELQKASNLFTSGYGDWWRKNPVFNKSEPGRNPK